MDLFKEFKKLESVFDDAYAKVEEEIDLDTVVLKDALKLQLKIQLRWEAITKKANWLFDWCEYEVDTAYAAALESELKDSYKSTKISEAREYAKANANYKKYRKLLVEARYLRDECRGVLEVITSRKYVLNNISNTVIAGAENHII